MDLGRHEVPCDVQGFFKLRLPYLPCRAIRRIRDWSDLEKVLPNRLQRPSQNDSMASIFRFIGRQKYFQRRIHRCYRQTRRRCRATPTIRLWILPRIKLRPSAPQ